MSAYKNKINLKTFFLNIILPTVLTIALFIVLIFAFIIPYFEQNMLNSKKEMINELVNTAIRTASKYEKESSAGLISVNEAKIRAIKVIEHLRYGIDNKDYFWITDLHPSMIMHPYRNDLNGQDLSDFKDANGKELFVEMVNQSKQDGEGYVDYMWQWMDDSSKIVPKISFVREFKPWGWIIGTGIYIEDVREEISAIEQKLILVSLGISAIMALLLTIIVRQNLQAEIKRNQAEEDLKESKEKYKALVEASTEGTGMFLERRCIYSNKKLLDLLEISNLDYISDDLHEIINPERIYDLEKVKNFNNSTANYLQIETQLITSRKNVISVLLSLSKITLSDKNGIIILIKELTLENETNQANDEYGKQLLSLSRIFNIGLFTAVPERKGRFIDVNEQAVSIMGFESREELLKVSIADLIEDPEERKRFFKEINRQTQLKEFLLHIRKKNGLYSVLSITAIIGRDENANVNSIYGTITDITEQKTMEAVKDDMYNDIQASKLFMNQQIKSLTKNFVSCELYTSIQKAAKLMTSFNADALLIKTDTGEYIGIVTDYDIRVRVIAENIPFDKPVFEFMSSPLHFISENSTLSDAVYLMQAKRITHLVVKNSSNNIIGILDKNELFYLQHNTSDFLITGISKAVNIDELKDIYNRLPLYVNALIESGVRTYSINRAITAVSDAITKKLAEIIIDELGSPPAQFTFIALGSEGREEQTLLTDQDNAIIYEDVEDSKQDCVNKYFLRFGEKMCDMLDKIGYNFCKGNVMAKNFKWNQSVTTWKKYFSEWINKPEPQNLVDIGIFFDFRCIYGDKNLTDEMHNYINTILRNNTAFLGQMARICVSYKTPLSIFGKIQTETGEEHSDKVNIKNPSRVIVNLVRLYTMMHEITETNTIKRLRQLYEKNVFSSSFYHDLVYAFDFLMVTQFKSQAFAGTQNRKMDHYIALSDFSTIEVNTLKYVFSQIAVFQSKVKYDFGVSE